MSLELNKKKGKYHPEDKLHAGSKAHRQAAAAQTALCIAQLLATKTDQTGHGTSILTGSVRVTLFAHADGPSHGQQWWTHGSRLS